MLPRQLFQSTCIYHDLRRGKKTHTYGTRFTLLIRYDGIYVMMFGLLSFMYIIYNHKTQFTFSFYVSHEASFPHTRTVMLMILCLNALR